MSLLSECIFPANMPPSLLMLFAEFKVIKDDHVASRLHVIKALDDRGHSQRTIHAPTKSADPDGRTSIIGNLRQQLNNADQRLRQTEELHAKEADVWRAERQSLRSDMENLAVSLDQKHKELESQECTRRSVINVLLAENAKLGKRVYADVGV